MQEDIGIGHNKPSLEDRIFGDPEVTVSDVLDAVASRIRRERTASIDEVSARARNLAGNADRIPEALDAQGAMKALELLSAIDLHSERVVEQREEAMAKVKSLMDDVSAMCKELDAGISPLEKKLRPLLEQYLVAKLDAHNAEREGGEEKLGSITERGPSGSKATYVDGWKNVVVDPSKVPAEYKVPDQKMIDKAIEASMKKAGGGQPLVIGGVERRRSGTLRVSK